MTLERILAPIDFSEHSRKALDYAAQWAERFGAALEILYVWSPPHYFSPDLMLSVPGWSATNLEQQARDGAIKEMERFLRDFERPTLMLKSTIDVGRPASSIVRVAEENRVDLIVMGTHGLTGIGRLLVGSVAQEVVAKAPCPVLTVKLHVDARS